LNNLLENIKLAFGAIRMNLLRAVLTIFIIGFGIMSLISMLTAVDGIKSSLYTNFAQVGSNTFTVSYEDPLAGMRGEGRWQKRQLVPITYSQARAFQQRYDFPAQVSLSFIAAYDATVQFRDTKTSPKMKVTGVDEYYLASSGLQVAEGRNFTQQEVQTGKPAVIVGSSLAEDLFGDQEGVGERIKVGDTYYVVIGVLKERGSSLGESPDDGILMPLITAQSLVNAIDISYDMAVMVQDVNRLDEAIYEATGVLRAVRRLELGQEDNFYISKSDNLVSVLSGNISYLTKFALIVGIITLVGAAVALTNIMLVTVKERTREIGVRKAMGATTRNIRNQFLLESITICTTGGLFGIAAGLIFGNLIARYFEGDFVIPWDWIIFGVALCIITGLLSGLGPAIKAARLDPIESLRHE
jgi:putative ABC transport system permease protein